MSIGDLYIVSRNIIFFEENINQNLCDYPLIRPHQVDFYVPVIHVIAKGTLYFTLVRLYLCLSVHPILANLGSVLYLYFASKLNVMKLIHNITKDRLGLNFSCIT